ncbi:MAG: acetoacetate decarboxylase family protein [Thermodesulfobacteriota bacterium]
MPVTYSECKLVNVVFKTDSEVLQKLVPKPLVSNPDGLMLINAGEFTVPPYQRDGFSFPGGTYLEVALGTPVKFGEMPGRFWVVLYLDKTVAGIVLGREVWGHPKKAADITFVQEGGNITSRVARFGKTLIDLSFRQMGKIEPVPVVPPANSYNLKYIPSVKKDAPPEVMQLTVVRTRIQLKEMYSGQATLKFDSLSADPLGTIPIRQIVSANYGIISAGEMDFGEVLHDYLAKEKK